MMRISGNLRTEYVPRSRWSGALLRSPSTWLAAGERMQLARFSDLGRRQQWLAGRWLSKQLIREELADKCPANFRSAGGCTRLTDIQIDTRDARGRGMRPRIMVGGRQLPWSLSISHDERGVLAALTSNSEYSLGVDLASKTVPKAGFLQLWFTSSERSWLQADPARRTATLWAMKEAAYKSCQAGESWSPRDVEVQPLADKRFACTFRGRALLPLWTQVLEIDDSIAALVCLPKTPASEAAACRPPAARRATTGGHELAPPAAAIPNDAWTLCDGRIRRNHPPVS